MKIAKQIALAALLGSLVATSAMAYGTDKGDCSKSFKMERKSQMNRQGMMPQDSQMQGMKHGRFKKDPMMNMENLNLTSEQSHEIEILRA
jgi:hypothetical protein